MKLTEEQQEEFFKSAKDNSLHDPMIIIKPTTISCTGYLYGECGSGEFTGGNGQSFSEAMEMLNSEVDRKTKCKNYRRDQLLAELKALDEGN